MNDMMCVFNIMCVFVDRHTVVSIIGFVTMTRMINDK